MIPPPHRQFHHLSEPWEQESAKGNWRLMSNELLRWTPLHRAAALGTLDELRVAEGSLEAEDHLGRTALALALMSGHREKVLFLLTEGARAEHRSTYDPLRIAIGDKRFDLAKVLLDFDAKPTHVDAALTTRFLDSRTAWLLPCLDQSQKPDQRFVGDYEFWRRVRSSGGEVRLAEMWPFFRPELADIRLDPVHEWWHFGRANPERYNRPEWVEMIRCQACYPAYRERDQRSYFMWTPWRVHQFALLSDGSIVCAGWFDSHRGWFNDLWHLRADGEVDIYGYPATHMAGLFALVEFEGAVWGANPNGVYRIDLRTFESTCVADFPIDKRKSTYALKRHNGRVVLVSPGRIWIFNANRHEFEPV